MHEYKFYVQAGISPTDIAQCISPFFEVAVGVNIIYVNHKTPENTPSLLNKKETLVLKYLAEGMIYREIAEKMGFTIDGTRFYIKKIFKKFEVDNAIKAINKGRQLHIIP